MLRTERHMAFVLFFFACFVCMTPVAGGCAADAGKPVNMEAENQPDAGAQAGQGADKLVSVEAEGQGETKIQAMKVAWMEAVRLGIGMYLDAKTTVIDDAAREEIVAHSRGRVDSYEELASEKTDAGWKVRIRANIEKDVLKETAGSIQSKHVAIDPNLTAQVVSEREKKLSGKELIATYQIPSWEKFFTLDFQTDQKDGQYVGKFFFRVNMDMYTKVFVEDLTRILDQVAVKKIEGRFGGTVSEQFKVIMREGNNAKVMQNGGFCSAIGERVRSQNLSRELIHIFIIINEFKYILYSVSREMAIEFAEKNGTPITSMFESGTLNAVKRRNNNIIFSIDMMEKNTMMDSTSVLMRMNDFFCQTCTSNYIIIHPFYYLSQVDNKYVDLSGMDSFVLHKTTFTVPIKLATEQIDKVDAFNGSFCFDGL